jgi:hypothetical protein
MEIDGLPVVRMSFRSEKVKKYTGFKSKLYQGLVKSYQDEKLQMQMISLENARNTRQSYIQASRGSKDDFVDSFVISCYFFVDVETEVVKFHEW